MAERVLRVVVIGAGMAGILAGIRLQQAGITDITLYEKADRIGGTWRDNTYPGLTCDTPSHHYTYSFERNPDWTRYLPPGHEIQAYFERTCLKYGIDRLIRFNQEVDRAEYRDGRWHLHMKSGAVDACDVLIAATGVLHHPHLPQIEGIERFGGAIFHTSRWDHSVPLDGARIGVIGNGSTGVQLVSALAGRASLLEHYQRTAQWIMPVDNTPFSEADRQRFRDDPAALAAAMKMEEYLDGVERYTQAIVDPGSPGAAEMGAICLANLENSVRDPVLRERLRPDHQALCKRLVFSPDYYEAIQHPHARLVTAGIERIEERGIRTRDGVLHGLDLIALATGFHADRFMRPMQMRGRGGVSLADIWSTTPKAYLAITMPDFPNFFMLNGPNGPVGNFSLIEIAEYQWGYIAQLLQRLRSGECTEIAPTQAAMERFERDRTEAAKKTVWYLGGCKSWYLAADGVPASWPWNYARFITEMSAPKWDAFELRA